MKNSILFSLISCFLIFDIPNAIGQQEKLLNSCFNYFYEQGEKALKENDYTIAILKFEAAEACLEISENDKKEARERIKESEKGRNGQLELKNQSLDRAYLSLQDANRITEADRFAFISILEREQKKYGTAMELADAALHLNQNANARVVRRAFSDATYYKNSVALAGHRAHLLASIWSPDGKMILTRSRDKIVKLWAVDG